MTSYGVLSLVVPVFLVVNFGSVMIDTVGFLTVIICIVRRVESSYFIIEFCFQPVDVTFEVSPPPIPIAPVVLGGVATMGVRSLSGWLPGIGGRRVTVGV